MSEMASRKIVNLHPTDQFDPKDHVVRNEHEDPYLPVTAKKLWFRAVNPNGVIRKEIEEITETSARVRVRLYLSRDDEDDQYIAEGYARRVFKDEPYKENFLEEAFRAATRAALTDAGFATGCAESEYAPVDQEEPSGDTNAQTVIPAPISVPPVPATAPAISKQRQAATNNPVISASNGIPLGKEAKQPEIPVVTDSAVETEMSLEEAFSVTSTLRKTYGQTLKQIVHESPDPIGLLKWIVEEYSGTNERFKTAAGVILADLEKRMDQAA